MATFDDFMKLDIRVGTIVSAKVFEKARRPCFLLSGEGRAHPDAGEGFASSDALAFSQMK